MPGGSRAHFLTHFEIFAKLNGSEKLSKVSLAHMCIPCIYHTFVFEMSQKLGELCCIMLMLFDVKFQVINCSQTKFRAIILVLRSFLCELLLDRFFIWRFQLFVLANGINI